MPFMATKTDLPIGIFDSGVGGLTVLKAVRDRLASESLIYLGDTARLPYGTKSAQTVAAYALEATRRLVSYGIKALLVADNTSSAHALDAIRAEFPGLPVIGVVEPGATAAAAVSAHGRIVVAATESTVQAGTYPRAILHSRPGASVTQLACPLFVSMVEEGLVDGLIAEQIAHHYFDSLFGGDQPADCLLLGCTHFPALAPLFARLLGPEVAVVDSASTTAMVIEDLLGLRRLKAPKDRKGSVRYLATDAPGRFARVAKVFVPWDIAEDEIEAIDL
jgi:glutamate racemase